MVLHFPGVYGRNHHDFDELDWCRYDFDDEHNYWNYGLLICPLGTVWGNWVDGVYWVRIGDGMHLF